MLARAGKRRGMTRKEAQEKIASLEPEATPEEIEAALNQYYVEGTAKK
jgi:hypothetical protein